FGPSGPTTVPPSPTPSRSGDPPASRATIGDQAILDAEAIRDLGIRSATTDGRRIVLELTHDHGATVLSRLVGGELVGCTTCRDLFGKTEVFTRAALREHDWTAHRDLWLKGRNLAEGKAIEERNRRKAATGLPPAPALVTGTPGSAVLLLGLHDARRLTREALDPEVNEEGIP
ncbi:MAG: hypothetical protein ACREDE_07955, partial [Thermoplasmata archaeon]